MSWSETLDLQRSALRWDIKRSMKNLCNKLSDIGEECFVVTINVSNGWVGHMGSIRGAEYINEKSFIPYDFLEYCRESDELEPTFQLDTAGSSETESAADLDSVDDSTIISLSKYVPDKQEETEYLNRQLLSHQKRCRSSFVKKKVIKLHSMKRLQNIHHARAQLTKSLRKNETLVVKPSEKNKESRNSSPPNDDCKGSEAEPNNLEKCKTLKSLRSNSGLRNSSKRLMFLCKVCNTSFKFKTVFHAHMTSVKHKLATESSYLCYKCGDIFSGKTDMYRHMTKFHRRRAHVDKPK